MLPNEPSSVYPDLQAAVNGLWGQLEANPDLMSIDRVPGRSPRLRLLLRHGAPPTFLPHSVFVGTDNRVETVPVEVARLPAAPNNHYGSTGTTATWFADGGVDAWLLSGNDGHTDPNAARLAHQAGRDRYPAGGVLPSATYLVWVQEDGNAFLLNELLHVDRNGANGGAVYRLSKKAGGPRFTWTRDEAPMVLNTAGRPMWGVADGRYGAVGRFAPLLSVVLGHEGGDSDHPSDKGGKTHNGITAGTWRAWQKEHGQSPRDVNTATDADVAQIYRTWFYDAVRGDLLPVPVDLVMFDSAVIAGPHTPIKWLQRSLGVVDDGSIGQATLQALSAADPKRVALAVLDRRAEHHRYVAAHDPSQQAFLRGWLSRVDHLRRLVGGSAVLEDTRPPGAQDSGGGGEGGLVLGALAILVGWLALH